MSPDGIRQASAHPQLSTLNPQLTLHTPEIRQKFIALRADAHSIPKIASLLSVAQSTLRLWEKDDALEIAHLRRSYWEDAEDKVGITIEHRLRRMAAWIKGAEDELEKRHFDLMNNRDLMRFLRESRREYFRLRAMLFNAPGARPTSPAATTAKTKTAKLNPIPSAEPSTADEIPTANLSEKIDKIGELADFPETQPRNTNDLQQSKSSPADFQNTSTSDAVTPYVRRGLTSPNRPANPEPSSAYAGSDSQTPQPDHAQGHSTSPSIPKSSNPLFYYSPENLFVPSTPFHSGEPIRLFLARCREADLAAAQLSPAGEGWREEETGTPPSAASPVPEPYSDLPPDSAHPNMTIALLASNLTMACSPAGGRDGKEFYG